MRHIRTSLIVVDYITLIRHLGGLSPVDILIVEVAKSIAPNIKWDTLVDFDLHPALFDILLKRAIKSEKCATI
jgi:hypothetical protein